MVNPQNVKKFHLLKLKTNKSGKKYFQESKVIIRNTMLRETCLGDFQNFEKILLWKAGKNSNEGVY